MAQLNKNGQRWVPILDPPIHIKPGYAAYDSGIAQDVFVKDITGHPYVGQVKSVLRTALLHIVEAACSADTAALGAYAGEAILSKPIVYRFASSAISAARLCVVLLLHRLPAALHGWRGSIKLLDTHGAPCFACLAGARMVSSKARVWQWLSKMYTQTCVHCAAVAGSNPLARLHESQGSLLVAVPDPGAPCLLSLPGIPSY